MLARLSELSGAEAVRVDVTGRTFVLRVSPAADRDTVAEEAVRILGAGSSRLDSDWIELETSDSSGDGTWISSAAIQQLSSLEARILSARWGAAAAKLAELGPVSADHLIMSLRGELDAEFERVHSSGGATDRNWFRAAFPLAFQRAVNRLGGELDAAKRGVVQTSLSESLGGQHVRS